MGSTSLKVVPSHRAQKKSEIQPTIWAYFFEKENKTLASASNDAHCLLLKKFGHHLFVEGLHAIVHLWGKITKHAYSHRTNNLVYAKDSLEAELQGALYF
jgi:hypothetical protein